MTVAEAVALVGPVVVVAAVVSDFVVTGFDAGLKNRVPWEVFSAVKVVGSLAMPATERGRETRSDDPGSARKEIGSPFRKRSPLLLRVSSGSAWLVPKGAGSFAITVSPVDWLVDVEGIDWLGVVDALLLVPVEGALSISICG